MADVEALAAVAFVRVDAPQVEIAMAAAAQKDQAGRDRAEADPANLAYVEEGPESSLAQFQIISKIIFRSQPLLCICGRTRDE